MSNITNRMLGLSENDGYPTAARAPSAAARQKAEKPSPSNCKPKAKLKKNTSTLSALLGEKQEPDDNNKGSDLIPSDAEEVSSEGSSTDARPAAVKPDEIAEPDGRIPTSAALVAPDATPSASEPLSPHQVPQPARPQPQQAQAQPQQAQAQAQPQQSDAMSTLLGEGQYGDLPQAPMPNQAPPPAMNGMPPEMRAESAMQTGSGMPEHVTNPGSINRTMDVFRKING